MMNMIEKARKETFLRYTFYYCLVDIIKSQKYSMFESKKLLILREIFT